VDQLLAALKSLLGGIVPTSQIVMDNLARILQKNVLSLEPERTLKNRPQGIPEWYDRLTRKERDILRLLLEGAENKSIAAELHLGEQTIKNYLSIIYSKIGVHDRNGAIRIAQLVKQYL
jgi:DNA-binding NarL/FixJ family response regulator